MGYCLPDKLMILIGSRYRTDSMQPETTFFQEEDIPFPERRNRTSTTKLLFDGDEHHCRWRWKFIADQHAVVLSWHVQTVSVSTDLVGEAEDSAWTQARCFAQETNYSEQPRFGPFRSARCNRASVNGSSGECCRGSLHLFPLSPSKNGKTILVGFVPWTSLYVNIG